MESHKGDIHKTGRFVRATTALPSRRCAIRYKYISQILLQQSPPGPNRGVVMSSGNYWKEVRRFTLHTFRDFGVGKSVMEDRIVDEVHEMIKHIHELTSTNSEIDLVPALEVCVA